MILRGEGFVTLEARNAPQAFRLAERLKGAIDLVVTDVVMPGDMNGMDLAYAVRRDFPSIPIIVISGYPTPKSERPAGAFEFIAKPFKSPVIVEMVRRLVPSMQRQMAAS